MAGSPTGLTLAHVGFEDMKLFREVTAIEGPVGEEYWPQILFAAEADRFELWAVNMGLFASGHSSLDYRVRDAESLRLTLLRFISDLKESLLGVLEYRDGQSGQPVAEVPGEPIDIPLDLAALDEDEGDDQAQTFDSDMELLLDSLKDPIDRLYKLSTRIRNPSSRFESSKALQHQKRDPDSGVDVLKVFEQFDYDYVSSIFLEYRKSNAIANLPLVAPNREDTEDDAENENVWEPIRSVLSQYKNDLSNTTESFLVRRIAGANVRRRRQFAYWKKHRDKLSQHARPFTQQIQMPTAVTPNPVNTEVPPDPVLGPVMPPGHSITTATPLNLAQVIARDNQSTASVSEYAPSTQVNLDTIDFPPAPKRLPNEKFFECPYCFTLCSTNLLGKRAWIAHLIHDLRPYVCTYEVCKNPNQLYDSRADWIQHEDSSHRRIWRCAEYPEESFASLDEYQKHLTNGQVGHSEDMLSSFVPAVESTLTSPDRPCPICSFYPQTAKELRGHIALHLERFSVFSLPRSVGEDDEDAYEAGSQNVNVAIGSSKDGDSDPDLDIRGENDLQASAAGIAIQRWKIARDRVFRDLGINRDSFRPESIRSPLRSMHDAASAHLAGGRFKQAEEVFMEILQTRRRAFGQENARTLASMSNLATVYEAQGLWAEADQLRREVMTTRRMMLGENHPDTLTSMANLALPYRNQGRLMEAEELEQKLREAEELRSTLMPDVQPGNNLDVPKDDQTKLFEAVRTGNEAAVKLLLSTEGVNPDGVDSTGRTALSWAAGFGDERLLKLLLATEGVDPDTKDSRGQTPLSWAADCGHDAIVELLLANNRVDPNSKDASGWTPLAWAASKGYESVVKLLLDRPSVDADTKSLSGPTPLVWAVINGYEGVVKMLLDSGRVNAAYEDSSGRTPLQYAESNGHEVIAELLQSHLEAQEELGESP